MYELIEQVKSKFRLNHLNSAYLLNGLLYNRCN